jgi:hypothetical protein
MMGAGNMTTITITGTPSVEDQKMGFEPTVLVSFENVEDATSLAYAFSVAARALGYTYVDSCLLMDEKDMTWDSQEFSGSHLGD